LTGALVLAATGAGVFWRVVLVAVGVLGVNCALAALLGEDLIGLLGSAFEGDMDAGAADLDLEGLILGDSGLAGVNFSGA